jgi:acyl carrier protein
VTGQSFRRGARAAGIRDERNHKVDNEEIRTGLAEIVEEVAGVAVDDVTVEKSFVDDLDIDSLSMVEIAVQAEDKFGVKIPDDELANLKTVGDAVNYIARNA